MDKKTQTQCAIAFMVFAGLCLFTSLFFNSNRGKSIREQLPAQGGIVGPIEVKKDKTVYLIEVKQDITRDNQWSSVTGELLDAQKNYLFGFGKGFWKETGYDSEGYWSERVTKYDMKITIPAKGTYFLNFETERSPGVNSNIYVTVSKKAGSALPFLWAGIIFLIISIVFYQIAQKNR